MRILNHYSSNIQVINSILVVYNLNFDPICVIEKIFSLVHFVRHIKIVIYKKFLAGGFA